MRQYALQSHCCLLAWLSGPGRKKVIRRKSFLPAVLQRRHPVRWTLYIAGQTGQDLKTATYPADFEAEVKQSENIGLVLKEAHMDLKTLSRCKST
jgi:hypothetical protein